jgi:hypothetical protein
MSVTTMTQGLDKARELLPVITIAKETLDAGMKVDGCATYSEYLAHLGVTVDQVRQWRRRLKKAGEVVTPMPAKKAPKQALTAPRVTPEPTVTPEAPLKADKAAKVHGLWKDGTSRCKKDTDKYPHANDTEKVTCGLCQQSLDATARSEAWLVEHPWERGWQEWDNTHWFNRDSKYHIVKTPRKHEYKVYLNRQAETPFVTVATLREAMEAQPQPQGVTPVTIKKTSAEATSVAIVQAVPEIHYSFGKPVVVVASFEQLDAVSAKFEAAVKRHSEWFHTRIAAVRKAIKDTRAAFERNVKCNAELVKPVAPQKPKGVTTIVKPLGTVLVEVNIEREKGYVIWELDQESEYVYHGKSRYDADSSREKPKGGIANWHHRIYDLNGTLSCAVFIDGADETAVTEALLIRLRDLMTGLNVWRDEIEQEYRKLVEDHWDTVRLRKEVRSRGAKRAAATRKERTGGRSGQILATIRDANTDGNSSRALKAAGADIPDYIAPEIRENIKDLRAGRSHFSACPTQEDEQ